MSAEIIKTPMLINQERRERMAKERFDAAVAHGTRGGYQKVGRWIRPLLAASPRSEMMRHMLAVCEARAVDRMGTAAFGTDSLAS